MRPFGGAHVGHALRVIVEFRPDIADVVGFGPVVPGDEFNEVRERVHIKNGDEAVGEVGGARTVDVCTKLENTYLRKLLDVEGLEE